MQAQCTAGRAERHTGLQGRTELQGGRGSPNRLHDVIIGASDDESESVLSGVMSDTDERRDSASLLPGPRPRSSQQ